MTHQCVYSEWRGMMICDVCGNKSNESTEAHHQDAPPSSP